MNIKLRGKQFDVKLTVLNIVIVVMVVFILIAIGLAVEEASYYFFPHRYDEQSFINSMEWESYGSIVSRYNENCDNGYGEDKDLQDCYAVARYFEAAFDYKVCLTMGDAAGAEELRQVMSDAEIQMGDYAFMADKMDAKLGINE